MTIEDIESFGFKRLDDELEPVSNEMQAVFSKLINTNTTPHYIRLKQARYNDTDWHVKKNDMHIVNVKTPEQLADVIWVLSGFHCRTFKR